MTPTISPPTIGTSTTHKPRAFWAGLLPANDQRWKKATLVKKAISRINTKAAPVAVAPRTTATAQSTTTRRSTTAVSAGTWAASLTRSSAGEIVSPPVVADCAFSFLLILE